MCGSCQEIGSTSAQRTAIDECPKPTNARSFQSTIVNRPARLKNPRNLHKP
jgi:hypothetical protein